MESSVLSVSVLPLFLSVFILLFHPHGTVSFAPAPYYTGDVTVNCGSKWNSTDLDGREWNGEFASVVVSGQSKSSVVVAKSLLGVDPVPYLTSRISAYPFHFTFRVSPGQKFIRFHFHPASYRGFEKCFDVFTVKAGAFVLLNHFSPSLSSGRLGVKYIVKEFCFYVEGDGELRITFSPSTSWEFKKHVAYAFVNGIEIISMPTGLYYTLDGHLGAPIVGQNYRFHAIDNSSALELVHRFNIGGNIISSVEDFGLFRQWTADADYFLESRASLLNHVAPKLAYTKLPKVYQTSWKIKERRQMYSFTWKIPVNVGFGYLVRLHFCDLDAETTDDDHREFSILINNQIAETHADVIKWSGGTGFPVYKDYVAMMKGDKEGSECNLFINLQSLNELSLGLLKGIEIFRLSNPDNCFASPSPVSLKKVSITWNLNVQKVLSVFSRGNAFGTGMTIIILIVNTLVYFLSRIWEENAQIENDEESAVVEPSNRRFSLSDIRSATQNFSDAFVIGKGGFGKVYKGLLSGFPKIVAIKRLSSFSRQGAREFWTEIETLSKLRHFNLVPLIGYCNEDGEMILIYQYISGGTLAENLYKFARKGKDCALLSWEQRLRICIGSARGLEYLHTGSETGIIHRDVKDTNILLGENFMPKIADFGLSRLEEMTQSYVSTRIKGTIGYLDPYYCATHRLTRKSDVYSFGIVMLVVLSGRPAIDTSNPGEAESLLVSFQECLSGEDYNKIVDPNIFENIAPGSLKKYLESVESCLQQKPKNRPTMAQLVGLLEQVLHLQENPIASASGDSSGETLPIIQFELETIQSLEMSDGPVATLEESAVSPPVDEFSRKKTPSRGEVVNRVRKPFWIWPWKIGQNRETIAEPKPTKIKKPLETGKEAVSSSQSGTEGLIFIDDSKPAFELEDLLTASAEVLGKGSCGSTYKAMLDDGLIVAVKRLKDVNVGKKEFELHMQAVGRISHENVIALMAYFYSKDEKMIIYDHYSQGSVSSLLHGNRGSGRTPLVWENRIQIAIGAARGIAHLHEMSAIHGNIKSSNIFLNSKQYGCVSEHGMSAIRPPSVRGMHPSGYQAPEVTSSGIIRQPSDVYSFGLLLIELLTGKSPVQSSHGMESIDLVAWVQSVVREEWTAEVFDLELLRYSNCEEEMVKMLQIGMNCVVRLPPERPQMRDVVALLEDIRAGN